MTDLLKHIKMAHGLAAGIEGKMILASYGEGIPNKVKHYDIGDCEAMAQCAAQWSKELGRNVYMPLVVMRHDLPKALKGGESDIIAVLGIVADFDDDDAKNWEKRLPVKPDYVYETSSGRFQAACLFTKPLALEEAKELGRRLKAFSGCDHGTADMSHIWRMPGTQNYPSKKKINEGRSPEPQTVKIVKLWNGSLICPNELSSVLPEIPDSVIELEDPGLASEINLEELSEDLKSKIINGVQEGKDDRSAIFYHVICVLQNMRFGVDSIYSLLAAHPYGIAQKYAQRGDLRVQVEKCFSRAVKAISDEFHPVSPEDINEIAKQKNPLKDTPLSFSSFISAGDATWHNSGIPLFKHLINRETVNVVFGPPNSGKSFLVLDMALNLAAGLDWAGYKCKEKMAVLYVCTESGSSFGKRVVAARNKLKIRTDTPLRDIPFAYYAAHLDLLNNKNHIEKIEHLIEELEEKSGFKCGLVIIDTLSASFGGGNENGEDMTKFANNMAYIKFNKKVATLIVHHTGKNESAGARGHSSLKCNIDTEIEVKIGQANKRSFAPTKQKDDATGKPSHFGLRTVELGHDDDGDLVTSCSIFFESDDFVDSYFNLADGLKGNQKAALLTIEKFQESEFLQWCKNEKTKDIRELMIKYWLYKKKNPKKALSLQQLLKVDLEFNYNNKSPQFQKCFDKVKYLSGHPEIGLNEWIEQILVNLSQALPNQKKQEGN